MDNKKGLFRNKLIDSPRKAAGLLAFIGGLMLYFSAFRPLFQALRGASEISWFSVKLSVVGGALLALGLSLLIWGERAIEFMNPPEGKSKVPNYVVSIIVAGACFAFPIAVESYIKSLSYELHY